MAERHAFSCKSSHVSPSRSSAELMQAGVACSDSPHYIQHRLLVIFRPYAEPQHGALHMSNRGKCYVVSCQAQLLPGSDLKEDMRAHAALNVYLTVFDFM